MQAYEVVLGKRYQDKVSGFMGIATATITYLNGCTQINLTPKTPKKAETKRDSWYFDVQQIELVDDGIHVDATRTATPADRPGGPEGPSDIG